GKLVCRQTAEWKYRPGIAPFNCEGIRPLQKIIDLSPKVIRVIRKNQIRIDNTPGANKSLQDISVSGRRKIALIDDFGHVVMDGYRAGRRGRRIPTRLPTAGDRCGRSSWS